MTNFIDAKVATVLSASEMEKSPGKLVKLLPAMQLALTIRGDVPSAITFEDDGTVAIRELLDAKIVGVVIDEWTVEMDVDAYLSPSPGGYPAGTFILTSGEPCFVAGMHWNLSQRELFNVNGEPQTLSGRTTAWPSWRLVSGSDENKKILYEREPKTLG